MDRRRRTRRTGARAAVAAGIVMIVVGTLVPTAAANYARIDARVGCDRVVVWQASASSEGDDDARTNERVRVEYRPAGTSDSAWRDAGDEGSFTAENGFSFGGEFDMPSGADSVELRATPAVPWGPDRDGEDAGEPRFATARIDPACERVSVIAGIRTDCASGSAQVTLSSRTGSEQQAVVAANGVALRTVEVGSATTTLEVPLVSGLSSSVEVTVGGEMVAGATVGSECEASPGSAVVLERCSPDGQEPARAAVVVRGDESESDAEVRLSGTLVNRSTVGPGQTSQQVVELPRSVETIEVTLGGSVVAVGPVGGCDTPVLGVLSCGSDWPMSCEEAATSGAGPAPPPPPPPLVLDLEGSTLPLTGPWQWAIGLSAAGALLLVGGGALLLAERRRPVPSTLGPAIDAYRQTWWDRG